MSFSELITLSVAKKKFFFSESSRQFCICVWVTLLFVGLNLANRLFLVLPINTFNTDENGAFINFGIPCLLSSRHLFSSKFSNHLYEGNCFWLWMCECCLLFLFLWSISGGLHYYYLRLQHVIDWNARRTRLTHHSNFEIDANVPNHTLTRKKKNKTKLCHAKMREGTLQTKFHGLLFRSHAVHQAYFPCRK